MEDRRTELTDDLWEMLEPLIQAEGMELVELEYRRESQGWVLRIFIDQPDGITVEDCARVSRVVGDLLDVADTIQNPYHLEISSPGLNRPLRKPEHFKMHLGNIIEVKTSAPLDPAHNRRKFKGALVAVHPQTISVDCQGEVFEIPVALVERARLCYFDSFEK